MTVPVLLNGTSISSEPVATLTVPALTMRFVPPSGEIVTIGESVAVFEAAS